MSLKAKHISKKFGENQVLKDVSLEVKKGQILSLTGESGCGKSTLLRIIAGLESPDQGQVVLHDEDITNWNPEKRRFGFVFQNLSLFPHLTVRGNIFFALKKKDQLEFKLQELLQMTGLLGLADRFPHELSGGQQQRVALARALAINPEILILDEPFSSLDELLKTKIREEIFELLRSLNITTILVSHQAADAFLIADELIVMRNGEIQQQGKPSDIYTSPNSPYVSNFFGASVIIHGSADKHKIATSFGSLNFATDRIGDCQLFFRPENIEIANESDFNLTGKVVKKEFKGPHDVLKISSNGEKEIISIEIERCNVQVGEDIFLKIPEKHIQLFN